MTTNRFQKRSGGSPPWVAGIAVIALGAVDLWAVCYIVWKSWAIWGTGWGAG